MKSYFTKKEQIVILIVIGIIMSIFGFKFFSHKIISKDKPPDYISLNKEDTNDKDLLEEDIDDNEKEKEELVQEDIIVHISGQVKNPGIVELKSGKRLLDAVDLLGGLTLDADQDRINLAKKLQDEEKIYIPKIGEEIELSLVSSLDSTDKASPGVKDNETEKIDLNTCTKEMLNTLPGIGDVLSGRIIDYREENIFKAIEDIMKVSGIGDKKFEGLKDLIIIK